MSTRILIAERDARKRDKYSFFLRSCGYDVETAEDAVECCESLAEGVPDVLILSEGLLWGGTDGVLSRMQFDFDVPCVPVVMLSNRDCDEKLVDSFNSPVIECLRKPVRKSELLKSLVGVGRTSVATVGSMNP